MPKTGSTAIQAALRRYRDPRIAYARLGPANHSEPLCTIYAKAPDRFFQHRQKGRSAQQVARLQSRYRARLEAAFRDDRDLILSGEMLCDHLTPAEIKAMLAELRRHYDAVRVIAYIRPFRALVPSMLQQRIRVGQARFELPAPGYRKRFQPWLRQAGADNLEFRLFDRAALAEGDIVADFATRLGLDRSRISARDRNEGLSLEALGILFHHNVTEGVRLTDPARLQARQVLLRQLRGFGTGKVGLDAALMAPHVAAHQADIDWIERVAGFAVSGPAPAVETPIRSQEHLLEIGRAALPGLRQSAPLNRLRAAAWRLGARAMTRF
ncbi:hypothetical protein ACFOES_20550 [Acidimangrovimonas pyrenivorans]|uniref:Sulfotransferase family protein n=2 Tax=Acidimangrovimonas pyrenivorans TaxID=2030798 RepID=A0ABV7AMM6_9RHOB